MVKSGRVPIDPDTSAFNASLALTDCLRITFPIRILHPAGGTYHTLFTQSFPRTTCPFHIVPTIFALASVSIFVLFQKSLFAEVNHSYSFVPTPVSIWIAGTCVQAPPPFVGNWIICPATPLVV